MGFFKELGKALGGGNKSGGDTRRSEDKAANKNKVTDPNTGKTYDKPSYSGGSVKGLTSKDPANVARNQAAAKMYADQEKNKPEKKDKTDEPKTAPAPAPAPVTPPVVPPTPTPPPAPAPVVPGEAPTSAVEAAAIESTQGGRQSTILTSALGLLADQEAQGLLRKRRSLIGGQIQ